MSEQWTNEPIKISLYDCKQVADTLKPGWDKNPVAAVMDVITAYNDFVTGDPVGTVRCNPKGVEVAVSCGPRQWWLFNETTPMATPRLISKDPVIPSWPIAREPVGLVPTAEPEEGK